MYCHDQADFYPFVYERCPRHNAGEKVEYSQRCPKHGEFVVLECHYEIDDADGGEHVEDTEKPDISHASKFFYGAPILVCRSWCYNLVRGPRVCKMLLVARVRRAEASIRRVSSHGSVNSFKILW
jgi:hypothetical protein